ncbi:hypothetical protein NDN08_006215 [Rhodosorus marinus]|uniref:Uncharacterized protein n=1 Tax=Rhodosorus marinus TaxID=101924 RepID=A0AAV8UK22_9RHOD|nr:hypothetical protein NDN08_006215 [Rhodosorus marinus]
MGAVIGRSTGRRDSVSVFADPSMRSSSGASDTRTCRVCKKQFTVDENHPRACRFHPGPWMGAENSKHYGIGAKDSDFRSGVSYFHDCCDAESPDAPGCTLGPHVSYDD